MSDDKRELVRLLNPRGPTFSKASEAEMVARAPDMIFRASLAAALCLDSTDRQDLLDMVRAVVKRCAELRHAADVAFEQLCDNDIDGARARLLDVLQAPDEEVLRG